MVTIVMKKDDKIKPKFQFLVSQLQETRKRLMELLEKVPDNIIDKSPDDEKIETVATLLDHIAAVEWSWIFEDIDGKSMDVEEWKYAFALRDWSEVKQRKGKTKQFYIGRPAMIKAYLIKSQLLMVEGKFKESEALLDEAVGFAKEKNLTTLLKELNEVRSDLSAEVERMQVLLQSNSDLATRLKKSKILEYIKNAQESVVTGSN